MILFYANPILIAAAVLPAIFLCVKVYRYDRIEKEPAGLLVSLILQGILATFLALITERAGQFVLKLFLDENSISYNAWLFFGVVAISEEGFKYLLLKRRTWNSPDFNFQFDGIVYAVFVSLGFALWENISYVLMYGFGTALVRAVTAIPGHACFGVFMGAWYGAAKRWYDESEFGRSKACRAAAFFFPVLLHGSYDFIASMQNTAYGWIFCVFVAVLFAISFFVIRQMSRKDRAA